MITSLTDKEIKLITKLLSSFSEIDKAILYGSRAKGNYKPSSDVDIAIFGSKVSFENILSISSYLNEETTMPYFFDILHYDTLENEELKKEIIKFSMLIYKKSILIKN